MRALAGALLHQPCNETDRTRHRLFVDVIRPSPAPREGRVSYRRT